MKTNIFYLFLVLLATGLLPWTADGARAPIEEYSADPYLGAIVIDADTGQVLFEDHSDAKGYPASILKLMDLLIILDKIGQGAMRLDDKINITAEAATIGGSQVYLKEHEVFTVDELLYALMIQSANDAATALAIQAAGSKDGFVELMNKRAAELGLKATEFHSIHGLPPAKDQLPDVTTARDLARLARELLKYPDCLRYTGCRERGFRDNKFTMRNHNHLLGAFAGCDGLKTGYFKKAGYSIAATAKRGNARVIAIVLGSKSNKTRDRIAAELMTKGLTTLAHKQGLAAAAQKAPEQPVAPVKEAPLRYGRIVLLVFVLLLAVSVTVLIGWMVFFQKRNQQPPN